MTNPTRRRVPAISVLGTLLLLATGEAMFAADLKVVHEAGKETLADDRGGEVVLELRQRPLTDTVIDMLPFGPEYSVTVYASRSVVFYGSRLVKTVGQGSHTLTEQEFEEMRRVLAALELQNVKSQTGHGSYYATLSASVRGTVHEIEFGNSNVEEYVQVRRSLEKYLRTLFYRCPVDMSKYTRGHDDFCADLFELRMLFPEGENRR